MAAEDACNVQDASKVQEGCVAETVKAEPAGHLSPRAVVAADIAGGIVEADCGVAAEAEGIAEELHATSAKDRCFCCSLLWSLFRVSSLSGQETP